MEILDASALGSRAQVVGTHAKVTQLHPNGPAADALLAVDLWEVEPGGSTPLGAHAEEHVLFVLSGTGELQGATSGGATVVVRPNSVVHIGHREVHALRNTGNELLRVLVSTPLLVRSERALGLPAQPIVPPNALHENRPTPGVPKPIAGADVAPPTEDSSPRQQRTPGDSRSAASPASPIVIAARTATPDTEEVDAEREEPAPDISGLMKRGSEIAAGPRPEKQRAAPTTESEAPEEQPEEEEEPSSNLMELEVVFDGGSRGNPGEGYGSFLVRSPGGRKPVIRRLEFGGNYTNNQAEYDSLIAALDYIISRLESTNRSPDQVQLDIRGDSDLVVNQLNGVYKVKDAGLRLRHKHAQELLERFAAWMISWHARDESVRLLGH